MPSKTSSSIPPFLLQLIIFKGTLLCTLAQLTSLFVFLSNSPIFAVSPAILFFAFPLPPFIQNICPRKSQRPVGIGWVGSLANCRFQIWGRRNGGGGDFDWGLLPPFGRWANGQYSSTGLVILHFFSPNYRLPQLTLVEGIMDYGKLKRRGSLVHTRIM